jgi:hypothetical protein
MSRLLAAEVAEVAEGQALTRMHIHLVFHQARLGYNYRSHTNNRHRCRSKDTGRNQGPHYHADHLNKAGSPRIQHMYRHDILRSQNRE